jgi:hypothetical protein
MFFKPRIFISSTLSENLGIRNELDVFFKSIGAEIMLYEKNLTPSVNPMTYRTDIKDADFVIFIIKDKYGTETDSGLSGTHEELRISLDNDIPKHVYIKLGEGNEDIVKIINEINKNQISFYYFKDDAELLIRIKETVFTIARDIMIRKVEHSDLSTPTVRQISTNHDYRLALGYLKIFEALIDIERKDYFDYFNSNLVMAALGNIYEHRKYNKYIFVDNKLNELLDDVLREYHNFSSRYVNDYTARGNYREINFPIYHTIRVCGSERHMNAKYSEDEYFEMIKKMLEQYYIFKDYIKDMKTDIDVLNFKE